MHQENHLQKENLSTLQFDDEPEIELFPHEYKVFSFVGFTFELLKI